LELTEDSKNFLVDQGFDEKFGARPLRRAMQKFLEDELAEAIIRGEFKEGYKAIADLDAENKKLKFTFEELPKPAPINIEEIGAFETEPQEAMYMEDVAKN
jgi:ATP-dependent Clp protease ATP-binding subunit ClpC